MNKIQEFVQNIEVHCPEIELRWGEPMANHTSFHIGGEATLMAFPDSVDQAIYCRRLANQLGVRTEILGRGSNLLVADEGIAALVLSTKALNHIEQTAPGQITAGAGVTLARLATFAAQQNLGGLVFAHGIPGSLGGAVVMNAGAYGGEMVQVVKSVRCITPQGELVEVLGEDAQFGYRHSIFCDQDLFILEVTLALPRGDCHQLQQEMAALATKRRTSQPLEFPSGGSMFKRPEGHYAAALIDQCGLKGFSVGDAQVSEKHAGFVINRGTASCRQVLELVEQVQQQVAKQTGVALEMEVKVLR